MSRREARELGRSAWTRVQALFLCRGARADDHDGFAELVHALDHVRRAVTDAVPEGHQDVAGLGHLAIAVVPGRRAQALPLGWEPMARHLVRARPGCPELVGASGATGDDGGHAGGVGRQRLTEQSVVGEAATPGNDDLHDGLLCARTSRARSRACTIPSTASRMTSAWHGCGAHQQISVSAPSVRYRMASWRNARRTAPSCRYCSRSHARYLSTTSGREPSCPMPYGLPSTDGLPTYTPATRPLRRLTIVMPLRACPSAAFMNASLRVRVEYGPYHRASSGCGTPAYRVSAALAVALRG